MVHRKSVFKEVEFVFQTDILNECKNKNTAGGRSQDGGGIGRVITFSSTNSLIEQQNGEQSLQNNF